MRRCSSMSRQGGPAYVPGGIVDVPDQEGTLPESLDTLEDAEQADDALGGPDLDHPAPPTTLERRSRLRGFLGILGPGLVTGVADDDPSGVATYSQAGAAFGVGLLWTAPLSLPLMYAVQEICDRTALVTGDSLGTLVRRRFERGAVHRQRSTWVSGWGLAAGRAV